MFAETSQTRLDLRRHGRFVEASFGGPSSRPLRGRCLGSAAAAEDPVQCASPHQM